MRILVVGASGGIGLQVVQQGLGRGHEIRAFARGADRMEIDVPGFEAWPGDATRPADLAGALDGVDAVMMTLGVPRTLRGIVMPTTLFSDATRALLPVMEGAGLKRLLVVTGIGAGDSIAAMSALERAGRKILLGRAYADKDVQEKMITASDLDWTIARPGILTDGAATGTYNVLTTPETWRNGVISRADVAGFLLRAAEDGSHIREAPVLVR